MVNMLLTIIALTFFMFLTSCKKISDHDKVVKDGIQRVEYVKEIENVFGESNHFVTNFGFENKTQIWNTLVYFGDQFELCMQVDIEIDYKKNQIIKILNQPKFRLRIIDTITIDSKTGYCDQIINLKDLNISEKDFKTLIKNKGDFTKIGIEVEDRKVLNFDKYAMQMKAHWKH